jgi:transposase
MATIRRQKTDIHDAHQLAQTHFQLERDMTHHQDTYDEQMRALSRYYEKVDEEINTLSNRLHAIIQQSFPELETLFSIHSALYLNIVQLFPHPDFVKNLSKTFIRNRIKANTKKNISFERAEKKGIALLEASKQSYPAIFSTDVRCDQAKEYACRLAELIERKEIIIYKMVALLLERKEYTILKSIPGIGDTTAVRLIAEIGDINRFKNHKQLNAYAGINICHYQSGKQVYKDRINKRGNNKLRKILYFMIQTMIRLRRFGDNHFVDYYDKLKMQPYNKCHKVASIACVNKFLKVAFHLITHNLLYNYEITSISS